MASATCQDIPSAVNALWLLRGGGSFQAEPQELASGDVQATIFNIDQAAWCSGTSTSGPDPSTPPRIHGSTVRSTPPSLHGHEQEHEQERGRPLCERTYSTSSLICGVDDPFNSWASPSVGVDNPACWTREAEQTYCGGSSTLETISSTPTPGHTPIASHSEAGLCDDYGDEDSTPFHQVQRYATSDSDADLSQAHNISQPRSLHATSSFDALDADNSQLLYPEYDTGSVTEEDSLEQHIRPCDTPCAAWHNSDDLTPYDDPIAEGDTDVEEEYSVDERLPHLGPLADCTHNFTMPALSRQPFLIPLPDDRMEVISVVGLDTPGGAMDICMEHSQGHDINRIGGDAARQDRDGPSHAANTTTTRPAPQEAHADVHQNYSAEQVNADEVPAAPAVDQPDSGSLSLRKCSGWRTDPVERRVLRSRKATPRLSTLPLRHDDARSARQLAKQRIEAHTVVQDVARRYLRTFWLPFMLHWQRSPDRRMTAGLRGSEAMAKRVTFVPYGKLERAEDEDGSKPSYTVPLSH
ncbi:hypothetical protein LXA43DRAFT_1104463 [Ganoderma leucocontextum]|nr:hypothetical protein LXA43DRAFT_1104463 [Ganoderma leucocontextum]